MASREIWPGSERDEDKLSVVTKALNPTTKAPGTGSRPRTLP